MVEQEPKEKEPTYAYTPLEAIKEIEPRLFAGLINKDEERRWGWRIDEIRSFADSLKNNEKSPNEIAEMLKSEAVIGFDGFAYLLESDHNTLKDVDDKVIRKSLYDLAGKKVTSLRSPSRDKSIIWGDIPFHMSQDASVYSDFMHLIYTKEKVDSSRYKDFF